MQPYGQYPAQPYPVAAPMGYPQQRAPQRNVALIVVGAILLFIALGAGFVFLMNLHQYLTVEDRWAHDPYLSPAARSFGVRIVQQAAMKRMMLFGPIGGVTGITGLVLGILGIRKK